MTDVEKSIILAFADNNMDFSKTARSAHYHRNSIYYQMHRIMKKYKLNPQKFYDLIELVKMAKGGEVANG